MSNPMKSRTQKAREAFDQAMAHLDAVGDEYRTARDQVHADKDLTAEAKTRKVAEVRDSYTAETSTRQRAAADALADYLVALEMTANPPAATGVEGLADRVEGADARARVRGLLSQGLQPAKILERAVALGDLTALDALKTEAQWLSAGSDREPAGGFVGRLPEQLIRRVELARADVIGGERGEAIREHLTMGDQKGAWIDKIQRAQSQLDAGPGLGQAIADHYAFPPASPSSGAGTGEGDGAAA